MITYEELFREMKKCKNNKEINELLDRFLEQEEIGEMQEEIVKNTKENVKREKR